MKPETFPEKFKEAGEGELDEELRVLVGFAEDLVNKILSIPPSKRLRLEKALVKNFPQVKRSLEEETKETKERRARKMSTKEIIDFLREVRDSNAIKFEKYLQKLKNEKTE